MARRPGIVDRFLGAALGGPPYYNFMLFPIGTDRLSRVGDGVALGYFDWNDFSSVEPPVLAEIRALTGLAAESGADDSVLLITERGPDLKPGGDEGKLIRVPFYVAGDPDAVPAAQCAAFAMSENPLRPRELRNISIRVRADVPADQAEHCLARALLRGLGLGGLDEFASGAAGPLTDEEKLFLWLAYRLPIGADRETLRAGAAEILEGL